MKWFPELHQYTFTRNDSWLNSGWITLYGLVLLVLTFAWAFVARPIFWMVLGLIIGIGTYLFNLGLGAWLTVKLGGRLAWYGPFGFASSRDISKDDLFRQVLEKAKARLEAAEKG